MNRKLLLPSLVLVLAVLACNMPAGTPPGPTDTLAPGVPSDTPAGPASVTPGGSPTDTPTTPPGGGLTLDMLRNGTYHAPFYNRTVTLVNGAYSEGTGGYTVNMLDVVAFGDLNGDHHDDAAIILVENGGGSGQFESVLAVTLQSGAPHQIGQAELGDRVLINSANISSGVIHLDMMVDGPTDPLCCPSLPEKQNYWMIGNLLWLMRVTTTTGGVEHAINITSPGNWASVSNPFPLNGNVSVLPFENTLAYKVYLIDGTVVNSASLTTDSSGMFSHSFNFSSAGITGFVIIQFTDNSAADGSVVALGSVIIDLH